MPKHPYCTEPDFHPALPQQQKSIMSIDSQMGDSPGIFLNRFLKWWQELPQLHQSHICTAITQPRSRIGPGRESMAYV